MFMMQHVQLCLSSETIQIALANIAPAFIKDDFETHYLLFSYPIL